MPVKQQLLGILYYTGKIHKKSIETHEVDWMGKWEVVSLSSARQQLNGITAACIDTPGHVDFTIEVQRSLVYWTVRLLFLIQSGVDLKLKQIWRQAASTEFRIVLPAKWKMVLTSFTQ